MVNFINGFLAGISVSVLIAYYFLKDAPSGSPPRVVDIDEEDLVYSDWEGPQQC